MADKAHEDEKVRIHIFDQKTWRKTLPQAAKLATARLHVSILDFLAVDNERLIPQQSASSVTNIDDIESYLNLRSQGDNKYLRAIDLPIKERTRVMDELCFMGITAGSLFPGLDGACEELKERFFRS